jgi:hypothetical protein
VKTSTARPGMVASLPGREPGTSAVGSNMTGLCVVVICEV